MKCSDKAQTDSNAIELLEFSGKRRVSLVMQTEVAECGLACLSMVASYHGLKIGLPILRQLFSSNLSGMNLQQLIKLADDLGLTSRALKCPAEEIGHISLPCILHWDLNHFVVLTGVTKDSIYINDPAIGQKKIQHSEFSKHYTGIALELNPAINFKRHDFREQMSLSQLWSNIVGLKSSLTSLLILSLILQLFALISPYYMQLVVDEVLLSHDQSLLTVLAIGFGLIIILNVFTNAVRSYLILRLSSMMNMQMAVNLLRHLLRLPMDYFEKRHIGDLVSRFTSLAKIRERLTTGLTETVVDGIMSIIVLGMMLAYSVKLTLVVLSAVVLYIIVKAIMYHPFRRNTEEHIQALAREQSNFIENIRGIQTVKLFNNESMRQNIWQNRYVEVINCEIRLGKMKIGSESINSLLFGLENIIVIYIAATLVMDKTITTGMIFAFIAYKLQFTERISNFIEQIFQFRMLKIHLERISDIAFTEIEANREPQHFVGEINGKLEFKNVGFRYAENTPWIIQNCNITINPGESIAIIGSSGCGKTTLIKLMLGLITPTSGSILIDGKDIKQLGLIQYRNHISAVMQNDTLLSGTIIENISFFDPSINLLRVKKSAQQAAIDEEIERMPMGYNTIVGDMGNAFSGGQVQRILLARALYKQPNILFLDEATSNLDVSNELYIGEHIKNLNITRITIAHRPETIRQASRVLEMKSGQLVEVDYIYDLFKNK